MPDRKHCDILRASRATSKTICRIDDPKAESQVKGECLKVDCLLALATETAEASAEWLHRRIREDRGFPDFPSLTMQELFTGEDRGKRYSFGYGACPNMEDQKGIWKLIGVSLTEGMMMEPEASVSALVFNRPDCVYFTAEVTEPASVA